MNTVVATTPEEKAKELLENLEWQKDWCLYVVEQILEVMAGYDYIIADKWNFWLKVKEEIRNA